MKKNRVGVGMYVALILLMVLMWYVFTNPSQSNYTMQQFMAALQKGEIESAIIDQNEQVPTGSVQIKTTAGGSFIMYTSDAVSYTHLTLPTKA